jgi:acyl-CoA thioesterase-1
MRRARAVLGFVSLLILVAACGGASQAPSNRPLEHQAATSGSGGTLRSSLPDEPRIVVLGDSLTAGFGLASTDLAFPADLQRRLDQAGYHFQVINAGVSGDTTAGGLRRLEWSLRGHVQVLIVALGGNDGLRGIPVAEMKSNLAEIIETAQGRGIRVLLAGMEAPPNYGPAYTREFHAVFRDLAAQYHVAFLPFLLAHVAGVGELNQADGIHPTPEGAKIVADNVWGVLQPMLGARETVATP